MTKKQKIWFWIFMGMFLVPELLWSPVANFVYQLSISSRGGTILPFRPTFLDDTSNSNYLSTVLFIQTLGLFCSSIVLAISAKNLKHKYLAWLGSLFLFLSSVVVFFLFGFSINLRSFGF